MMRVAVLSWIGLCLLLKNVGEIGVAPLRSAEVRESDAAAGVFTALDALVWCLQHTIRNDVKKFTLEHSKSVATILSDLEKRLQRKKKKITKLTSNKSTKTVPPLFTTVPVQEHPLDEQRTSCSGTPPTYRYSPDDLTSEEELPDYTPGNRDVSERPDETEGRDERINLRWYRNQEAQPATQMYQKCMQQNKFEMMGNLAKMWKDRAEAIVGGSPFSAEEERERWTWLFALATRSVPFVVRAISAACFRTASGTIMLQPEEGYPLPKFMFWAEHTEIPDYRSDIESIKATWDRFNLNSTDFAYKQVQNVLHLIRHRLYTYTHTKDTRMLDGLEAAAAETFLGRGSQSIGVETEFLTNAIQSWTAAKGVSEHDGQLRILLDRIEKDALSAQRLFGLCIGGISLSNVQETLKQSVSLPYQKERKLPNNTVLERNLRLAMAADILKLIANSVLCFIEKTQ